MAWRRKRQRSLLSVVMAMRGEGGVTTASAVKIGMEIYIGADSNRVSLYSPGCPENSLCRIGWPHIQRCAAP